MKKLASTPRKNINGANERSRFLYGLAHAIFLINHNHKTGGKPRCHVLAVQPRDLLNQTGTYLYIRVIPCEAPFVYPEKYRPLRGHLIKQPQGQKKRVTCVKGLKPENNGHQAWWAYWRRSDCYCQLTWRTGPTRSASGINWVLGRAPVVANKTSHITIIN